MTHTSPGVAHPAPGTRLDRALRRAALCAGLALALAGCHHGVLRGHACNKRQHYEAAKSLSPLRVPPGVDQPDTHGALKLPALNEPAPPPRRAEDPCLDEPPPFTAPSQTPAKRTPSG